MITTNNKTAAESLNMFVFTFVCLNNEEKEKRDDYIAKKKIYYPKINVSLPIILQLENIYTVIKKKYHFFSHQS
jgi:hypothetical protein